MMNLNRWVLPEGVEELLPDEAWRMEMLRSEALGHLSSSGYELVVPPLIEYLDSLLTGTGEDLEIQTFKVIDQLSGRTMGVRADMTPQVARIDAHTIKNDKVSRLCYVGPTLTTRPQAPAGTREPLQLGAELFGCPSPEGDGEVIQLMVDILKMSGAGSIHLDLAHVGVVRQLMAKADLEATTQAALFDALRRKSEPDIQLLNREGLLSDHWSECFIGLVSMHGPIEQLTEITAPLSTLEPPIRAVDEVLTTLKKVADLVSVLLPDIAVGFDLTELRGYRYETGVAFAAYLEGEGEAIARGGRYDDIGEVFGHPRPATGFSTDLRRLLRAGGGGQRADLDVICAPYGTSQALHTAILKLKAEGKRVVYVMPESSPQSMKTIGNHQLIEMDGKWQVIPLQE